MSTLTSRKDIFSQNQIDNDFLKMLLRCIVFICLVFSTLAFEQQIQELMATILQEDIDAYLFLKEIIKTAPLKIPHPEPIYVNNTMEILQEFYNSLNGDYWMWDNPCLVQEYLGVDCLISLDIKINKWNFTGYHNPCYEDWFGIECEISCARLPGVNCPVVGITLSIFNLTGTLPQSLYSLASLESLDLSFNLIHGTFPSEVSNLTNLITLDLTHNKFPGELPNCFGTLSYLSIVLLGGIGLTGSIPNNLYNFVSTIKVLALPENSLWGTIPQSLATFSNLTLLELHSNRLHGSISSTGDVPLMKSVFFMDISANRFTGNAFSWLKLMPNMSYFSAGKNHITGNLNDITTLTQLSTIKIGDNLITGSLPALSFHHESRLLSLSINNNMITGSMESAFCSYGTLMYFDANANHISGSIPYCSNIMKALRYIYLENNYISGTIPNSFSLITELTSLSIAYNFLTGKIPSAVFMSPNISNVLLQSNYIWGELDDMFPENCCQQLTTFDLGQNAISGTISPLLFQFPRLLNLVMVDNCFHGRLPSDAICASVGTIAAMLLDGLASSETCSEVTFGNVKLPRWGVVGTIPSCIFTLPFLVVLGLSGNLLTGTLPNDVKFQILQNISLSNNRLTGTIPEVFQTHVFRNLDLSFNLLKGTCNHFNSLEYVSNFGVVTGNVSLNVNRLSGDIPAIFQDAPYINVMIGNLFYCKNIGGIPRNDPNRNNMGCGTNYIQQLFYSFGGIFCISFTLFFAFVVYYVQSNSPGITFRELLSKLYQIERNYYYWNRTHLTTTNIPENVKEFISVMIQFRRLGFIISIVIYLVLIPIYLGVKSYDYEKYATITFQYAFRPSAAFITGDVPGYCLFVVWYVLLIVIYVMKSSLKIAESEREYETDVGEYNDRYLYRLTQTYGLSTYRDNVKSNRVTWMTVVVLVLLFCINMVVSVSVNAYYASLIANATIDQKYVFFVQLAISLYKMFWNVIVLVHACAFIRMLYLYVTGKVLKYTEPVMFLMFLFNFIAAPCVSVMIIAAHCFRYFFFPQGSITAMYVWLRCEFALPGKPCLINLPTLSMVRFKPNFIYSYQCASSVIRNYSPVFVLMYILYSFGYPVALLVVRFSLPAFRSSIARLESVGHLTRTQSSYLKFLRFIVQQASKRLPLIVQEPQEFFATKVVGDRGCFHNAHVIYCNLYCHIAVMLTFGITYPPISTIAFLAISNMTFIIQFIMNDIITYANDSTSYKGSLSTTFSNSVFGRPTSSTMSNDTRRRECMTFLEVNMSKSINGFYYIDCIASKSILGISSIFLASFLFDTFGIRRDTVDSALGFLLLTLLPQVWLFEVYVAPHLKRTWIASILLKVENLFIVAVNRKSFFLQQESNFDSMNDSSINPMSNSSSLVELPRRPAEESETHTMNEMESNEEVTLS